MKMIVIVCIVLALTCTGLTEEVLHPCSPSPCGTNTECRERGGAAACVCLPGFSGDALTTCRPRCSLHAQCGAHEACVFGTCRDPCPGSCGQRTTCHVTDHVPSCSCQQGHTGDPFIQCNIIDMKEASRSSKLQVPTCSPGDVTNPDCPRTCIFNSECPSELTCLNNKCIDPCASTCDELPCTVEGHTAVCSDIVAETFCTFNSDCSSKEACINKRCIDPCPIKCGNAPCSVNSHTARCGLKLKITNDIECKFNSDCPVNKLCVNKLCVDPCPISCGNMSCSVVNHIGICGKKSKITMEKFCKLNSECALTESCINNVCKDPCPLTCGDAQCKVNNHRATCEKKSRIMSAKACTFNADCDMQKACINKECIDPCTLTCGNDIGCSVQNHSAICNVGKQCTFNADCSDLQACINKKCVNPCIFACGNNPCSVIEHAATCLTPPSSANTTTCTFSTKCTSDKACVNGKCVDPCEITCGVGTKCSVNNHVASCLTPPSSANIMTCTFSTECTSNKACVNGKCVDPCEITCGVGTKCSVNNYVASCFTPPSSANIMTCTFSTECTSDKACVNGKCVDPCEITCGLGTKCSVNNHFAKCE